MIWPGNIRITEETNGCVGREDQRQLYFVKILLVLVFVVVRNRRFCNNQTTHNYILIDMLLYTCP